MRTSKPQTAKTRAKPVAAGTRDFDQVINDLDGNPIPVEIGTKDEPNQVDMTLGIACITALNTVMPGDEHRSPVAKFEAHMLSQRIHRGGEVALSVEELAMLKERTGKCFLSPAMMGPIWMLLDPMTEGLQP